MSREKLFPLRVKALQLSCLTITTEASRIMNGRPKNTSKNCPQRKSLMTLASRYRNGREKSETAILYKKGESLWFIQRKKYLK
jgi:hypothetical protein